MTLSPPVFTQLNILPLPKMYFYSAGVLFFGVLHSFLELDIFPCHMLSKPNCTQFSSRQNLLLPKVRTNDGKFSLLFSADSFWNDVPLEIKVFRSLQPFMRKLKMFLASHH